MLKVRNIVRRRNLKLGRSEAGVLVVTVIGGLLPWWKNQKGASSQLGRSWLVKWAAVTGVARSTTSSVAWVTRGAAQFRGSIGVAGVFSGWTIPFSRH